MKTREIYCLAGMHRSGTSLMSSYLQYCHIPMGEELLGSGFGNRRGHYEDKEFVEFHKELLRKNRSSTYVPRKNLHVDVVDREIAEKLFENRCQRFNVWGWKDPRSTLFLDLWAECNPGIRFIFLYRDPREVVDSLCRRLRKFKSPVIYLMPWLGSIAWLRYNERIMDFYNRFPERSILVSIAGFTNNHENASRILGEWLSIDDMKPFSDVYHPDDMEGGNRSHRITIFDRYQNAVVSLFSGPMTRMQDVLDSHADIPSSGV